MSHTILVVDDNEVNLKLAREILITRGYQVVSARRGEQAIEMAQLHRLDLMLLDMQLPDIDGLEVLRRLRSQPETQSLPIVAMTAQAMAGAREHFLAAGCDGYIAKPLFVQPFLAEVQRHLTVDGPRQ
jgi:two-component system, cell cycle response regulator DivK